MFYKSLAFSKHYLFNFRPTTLIRAQMEQFDMRFWHVVMMPPPNSISIRFLESCAPWSLLHLTAANFMALMSKRQIGKAARLATRLSLMSSWVKMIKHRLHISSLFIDQVHNPLFHKFNDIRGRLLLFFNSIPHLLCRFLSSRFHFSRLVCS